MPCHLTDPNAYALTMPERVNLEANDEDNAARVLSAFGGDLVFVSGRGWAVWDGTRYSLRSGGLAAREIGHKMRALVLEEAEWAAHNYDPDHWQIQAVIDDAPHRRPPKLMDHDGAIFELRQKKAAELRKHATKCGNVNKVRSALETCEHQRRAEVEDMDNDPWTFTLPNGDLDLRDARDWCRPEACEDFEERAARTAWLRPQVDRAKLPTKCAGVAYDPAATCPGWLAFLDLIMPDPSIRACLQRVLGATLFGENRAQVCIFLRGPGGNGKSTLLNVLSHVLGREDGYAAPCKVEMFLDTGQQSASAATPEEADLPGARAYIATEPGARDVLSAKKIKGLTGGDRRISRGLFADPFFWTPKGLPIISCNRTPKIKDEDEGTRRRLVFFPFDVNLRALPIEKQRAQGEVEAELMAEGSGILNWLVDGFRVFMDVGVAMPEPMVRLKAQLLEAADPVGVFLDEMTVRDNRGKIKVKDFYICHEKWCEAEGRTLYQMKTVGDLMVEKGSSGASPTGFRSGAASPGPPRPPTLPPPQHRASRPAWRPTDPRQQPTNPRPSDGSSATRAGLPPPQPVRRFRSCLPVPRGRVGRRRQDRPPAVLRVACLAATTGRLVAAQSASWTGPCPSRCRSILMVAAGKGWCLPRLRCGTGPWRGRVALIFRRPAYRSGGALRCLSA